MQAHGGGSWPAGLCGIECFTLRQMYSVFMLTSHSRHNIEKAWRGQTLYCICACGGVFLAHKLFICEACKQ